MGVPVSQLRIKEGGIGIFGFTVLNIFLIGLSVFASKDVGFSVLVFNAVCGFFVFVKNTSGFPVLVPNVVFWFSYFFSYLDLLEYTVLYAVFDEFFFGFAVSSIPQCPPH